MDNDIEIKEPLTNNNNNNIWCDCENIFFIDCVVNTCLFFSRLFY